MLTKRDIIELKRLMSFMKPQLGIYVTCLLVQCISITGLSIAIAFALKDTINAPVQGNPELLSKAFMLIGGAVAAVIVLLPLAYYFFRRSIMKTMMLIKDRVFEHIEKLPVGYYEKNHSGDTISRITNDLHAMESAFYDNMLNLAGSALTGLGSAAAMLALNWRVALLFISLSIVLVVVNLRFVKPIRKLSDDIQSHMGLFTQRLNDLLSGFFIMKIFRLENIVTGNIDEENKKISMLGLKRAKKNAALDSVNFLLSKLSFAGILAVGIILVLYKVLDFGTLATLVQLQEYVSQAYLDVGSYVSHLQVSLAGTARVFELLDEKPELSILSDCEDTSELAVEFRNISFCYDKGNNVLKDFSIKVRKGETAALVGDSGGGKSTVIKLILGFYPPEEGSIYIEGKPISCYSLNEIRGMTAYVSQDSYLFDGSIEDNIRYGKLDASREEIIEAAKAAKAHDFIMEFPGGYGTEIGERGSRLSGGQRQRIALARAFLRNASILLLDEATSALDSESEQQVHEALNTLMKGRTVIVIAHRLSTVEKADVIYVVEKGAAIEAGSHKQLMALNGVYSRFYNLSNMTSAS